ncbi:hypothetical protein FQA39_LY19254 [Lamprigera yunnana]|nr:hypothetical protein FQA39_LY19254 [Lamprigera yunnana]
MGAHHHRRCIAAPAMVGPPFRGTPLNNTPASGLKRDFAGRNEQLTHDLIVDVLPKPDHRRCETRVGTRQAGVRLVQVVKPRGLYRRFGAHGSSDPVPKKAEAVAPAGVGDMHRCNTGVQPVTVDEHGDRLKTWARPRLFPESTLSRSRSETAVAGGPAATGPLPTAKRTTSTVERRPRPHRHRPRHPALRVSTTSSSQQRTGKITRDDRRAFNPPTIPRTDARHENVGELRKNRRPTGYIIPFTPWATRSAATRRSGGSMSNGRVDDAVSRMDLGSPPNEPAETSRKQNQTEPTEPTEPRTSKNNRASRAAEPAEPAESADAALRSAQEPLRTVVQSVVLDDGVTGINQSPLWS